MTKHSTHRPTRQRASTDPVDQNSPEEPNPTASGEASDTPDDPIANLDYAETKAAIADHTQQIGALQAHLADLELAYKRSEHWKDMVEDPPLKTDEGVPYAQVSTHRIVNIADPEDKKNSRRLELHVVGRLYTHVEETSTGEWIYRNDT